MQRHRFRAVFLRSLAVLLALQASLSGISPAISQDMPPPDPVEERFEGPEIYRRLLAGSARVVHVNPERPEAEKRLELFKARKAFRSDP
jgi:hypothetical protein